MYLERLDLVATMTGAGWWASLTGIRSRYSSGLSREQLAKRARALLQWVKLTAWKVGDRGFEPRSGIKVSKKQNVFPCSLVNIQYRGEPP